MAKDYAKPHSTAKTQASAELPRWGWFTVGFSFGLFTAFLIYLWQLVPADEAANLDKPTAKLTEQANQAEAEDDPEEFKLEFYDLFPKHEVPVVEEYNQQGQKTRVVDTRKYALQAGSFKLRSDADRLRGELILMGMTVHIRTITAKDGVKWHRVVVGPLDTKLALNRARTRLAQDNIQSLTLRIN